MAIQTLTFETCLSVGSAVAAFISALLWVVAARARVPHDPKPDKDGWVPASISTDGDDFIETVKSKVNGIVGLPTRQRLLQPCRGLQF